ncbi:hypothetical protein CAOG_009932 [Capsaspora owczarzaki ATCC 30864]|uniref:G-protein coupled receptors family 3 profile domain-containing protein n=2 Tax=Capsaspora owczarzaki (strain ATCC 30864) TaxID=595528 RepID=A0A0D2UKA6_CAPO3|nr:hypothetical protein CAOG_009932 [Capsaspora owczarzaki ATCC 30864]
MSRTSRFAATFFVAVLLVVAAADAAPRIHQAQPNAANTDGTSTTLLNLSGDFGVSAPAAGQFKCLFGSTQQQSVAATWISSTTATCVLPTRATLVSNGVDVIVRNYLNVLLPAPFVKMSLTLDNGATLIANWLPIFFPVAPALSTLSPDRGPTTGNTVVSVQGANILDSRDLRCKFNGQETVGAYVDSTHLQCPTAPQGSAANVNIEVKSTPKHISMAHLFDGVNDFSVAPIPTSLLQFNLTVEIWFRPATPVGLIQALVDSCVPGETPETNCNFWIETGKAVADGIHGEIGIGHEFGAGSNQQYVYSGILDNTYKNKWTHIALVREVWDNTTIECSGSSCPFVGEYRTYVNGELLLPTYKFTVNTDFGETNTYVGSLYTTSFYNGGMDDFRILNYPMTQAQVQQSMEEVYSGFEDGVLVSWDFEPNNQQFTVLTYNADGVTPNTYTLYALTPSNVDVSRQLNMGGGTNVFIPSIIQTVAFADYPSSAPTLNFLYYTPETITTFAPMHGVVSGGTVVTIQGTGFLNSTYLYCRFGSATATPATFIDATTLECTAPAFTACSQSSDSLSIPVYVSNNNQQFVVSSTNFTYYQAPTIQSVAPSQAPLAGNVPVTIYGSGFVNTPEFRCLFGVIAVVPVSVTATSAVCVTPDNLPEGAVVASVTIDGQTATTSQVIFTAFDQWSQIESTAVGIAIILGIGFVMVVCVHIWLFINRNQKIVKASAPLFGQFILFGAYLGFGAVAAFFPTPTDASCTVGIWFVFLSFTFMFASLFIKNWRIQRIFTNKKLGKNVSRNLGDSRLVLVLFVFVAIMAIILAVWTGTSNDKVEVQDDGFSSCYVNPTFQGILFAYMGLMLLFGIVLAFRTRNIQDEAFNESKMVSVAIYNVAFVTVIMIPLVSFTTDVRALLVMKSVGILFAVLVTVGLVFFPKIWAVALHKRRA